MAVVRAIVIDRLGRSGKGLTLAKNLATSVRTGAHAVGASAHSSIVPGGSPSVR